MRGWKQSQRKRLSIENRILRNVSLITIDHLCTQVTQIDIRCESGKKNVLKWFKMFWKNIRGIPQLRSPSILCWDRRFAWENSTSPTILRWALKILLRGNLAVGKKAHSEGKLALGRKLSRKTKNELNENALRKTETPAKKRPGQLRIEIPRNTSQKSCLCEWRNCCMSSGTHPFPLVFRQLQGWKIRIKGNYGSITELRGRQAKMYM